MNKQELIDKWESKTGAPAYEISDFSINPSKNEMYIAGYGVARKEILEDLKQLDEQQKPVVPEFVADWFEEHKRNLDYSIWEYIREWDQQDRFSDFHQWFDKEPNNPIEILIRMKDGYEVEKEPLYHVKLKIPGATYYLIQTFLMPGDTHMCFSAATERYGTKWKNTFTESEIKAIDERYWAFAVPVEVVEG